MPVTSLRTERGHPGVGARRDSFLISNRTIVWRVPLDGALQFAFCAERPRFSGRSAIGGLESGGTSSRKRGGARGKWPWACSDVLQMRVLTAHRRVND